jgi:hypothetical protein
MIMMDVLIEESAKAIFFRDMVDGKISQNAYDIWEIATEPDNATGERIQERYRQKAKKHLAEIGAI